MTPSSSRVASGTMSQGPPDSDVLARLALIEAESNVRREELRRIAAELPATVSRRALLRAVAVDLRDSPNKAEIVRRSISKMLHAPLHAAKRLQLRMRAAK